MVSTVTVVARERAHRLHTDAPEQLKIGRQLAGGDQLVIGCHQHRLGQIAAARQGMPAQRLEGVLPAVHFVQHVAGGGQFIGGQLAGLLPVVLVHFGMLSCTFDIDAVGEASQIVASTQKALADGTTDLIFLHMRAPDSAGHGSGWLGSSYLKAVRSVDADLGKILETIDGDARVAKRAAILLTADHGGPEGEKSHSDEKLYADYRIPFIAWGNGVASGADLYKLNAGRQDPGRSRPAYDSSQPIRNMDLANTALSLLGLDPIPGAVSTSWPELRLK